jgi:hypothetical protein
MANENKDSKQQAPVAQSGKTPVSKEEVDAIKNDVLKSVVGGVSDGSADWGEAGVTAYAKFSSC